MEEHRTALRDLGLALMGLGAVPATAALAAELGSQKVNRWVLIIPSVAVAVGFLMVVGVYLWTASVVRSASRFEVRHEERLDKPNGFLYLFVGVTNNGPVASFQAHVRDTSLSTLHAPWPLPSYSSPDQFGQVVHQGDSVWFALGHVAMEAYPLGVLVFAGRRNEPGVPMEADTPICVTVSVSSSLAPKKAYQEIDLEISRKDGLSPTTVRQLEAGCSPTS